MEYSERLALTPRAVYRRSDIHNTLGGQRQGGISTPSTSPVVLLFTGEAGVQYGYQDHWSDDGRIFFYTGEGQVGDMSFVRGNGAIRDHLETGKDLLLFQTIPEKRSYVRFLGQMARTGHRIETGRDIHGQPRKIIIFELTPWESYQSTTTPISEDIGSISLDELKKRALEDSSKNLTPEERLTSYFRRSEEIRMYALARASGVCEGCSTTAPFNTKEGQPYLEVHHINRLSDGGPDHPQSVIALCPNCHRRAHYTIDSESFNENLLGICSRK